MTAKEEWQWIPQVLNAAQNLAKQLTSIVNKNQIVHAPGGHLRQCTEGGKILYNKHCSALKRNNLPTSGYLFFWDFSLFLAADYYQKQYSFQEITAERRIQPFRGVYKLRNETRLWKSEPKNHSQKNHSKKTLRAAIRNFHLGPCKIEKSKIANKGLPKPFIKIQVSVYFGKYFTVMYRSNRSFNIPPPGHIPGIWLFAVPGV